MWKITTCGFTLEEVLILVTMNLLASAESAGSQPRRTTIMTATSTGRARAVVPTDYGVNNPRATSQFVIF
jgi:hypothetical protein